MIKYEQDYKLVAEAEELVYQAYMKAENEEVSDLIGQAMTKLLEFLSRDNMKEVEIDGTYGLWAKAADVEKVIMRCKLLERIYNRMTPDERKLYVANL